MNSYLIKICQYDEETGLLKEKNLIIIAANLVCAAQAIENKYGIDLEDISFKLITNTQIIKIDDEDYSFINGDDIE